MHHARFWVGTALFLLSCCLGFAQTDNANVSGVISDASGAAVPNAKVTLKNESTGLVRQATTNESGVYSIPTVPPGYYTMTAEATGFKKHESTGNKVDPSVPANISATLEVGALTETVEVKATVTPLQTESGALGRVVEGRQLQDIQLNGRNPLYLALLKPGVRGSSLASFSYAMTTASLSINGSRTQDNLITYDGAVAVRTRSNGTSIGSADLDSASEVQILTAAYGAEYGRGSGGQIRIITKSGTSEFHGSLYEYLRNEKLDANSWANNTTGTRKTPMRFNQFGYNFSGPITIPGKFNTDRSKLFFSFSQEFVRYRTYSSGSRTVPSEKMKQGDFSELLGPNLWYNTVRTITDPSAGVPFPNNVIPASRLSKNGIGLLKVFPAANLAVPVGSTNWYALASSPTNQWKDTIGIDYLPTAKDNLRLRVMLYHYNSISPFVTNFLISGQVWNRPNQTASLNWTHTFSPTFLVEATATASRDQVYIGMQDTPAFNRTTYGINYDYLFGSGSKDRPNKLPAIAVDALSTYTGSPYPSQSTGPIYSGSANFTKIISNHTLKFGALLERAGQNDYDQINVQGVPGGTDNQNGRFVFSNTTARGTGLAMGNVAIGLFETYAEIGTRSYTPYRGHMFEAFVQDEWKATPKMKLIYGARWTVVQPYYSLWNNMTIFDPALYNVSKAVAVDRATGNPIPGSGDKYNGISLPGTGWPDAAKGRVSIASDRSFDYLFRGISRSYSDINWNKFQPRLGIAYQLTPKFVLRAGGGRYLTRLGVSDSVFLGGNPPLQPMASVSGGSVDNPGGGTAASFPLSVTTQAKYFPMPESYNWTITAERELAYQTVVGVSYVGRRGLHGQRERNINQLPIGTLTSPANTSVRTNENWLRPYAGYGGLRITENASNSQYNALQLEVTRRFTHGLSYGLAYTWSRCMDDNSAQRDVLPDAFDGSYLWGPCNFDATHVAVINFVWELPWLKQADNRLVRHTLGGWRMSGVMQFETGTPFSVWTSDDFAGVGSGSANNLLYFWKYAGYGSEPQYAKQYTITGDKTTTYLVVKDSSGNSLFTRPASGTMVKDKLRNYFRNPGSQNWNIGLMKEFGISDRHKVLFRAEAFNWINHPNWGGVSSSPTSSTFGQVTSRSGNRNMQLSLRYSF